MNRDKRIITYEEVIERLKNQPLEEYTKQDIQDRYIAYRYGGRTKYTNNTKFAYQ